MESVQDSKVPLSNYEVLKVLKARKEISEFTSSIIDYLEEVTKKPDIYPLEKLRNIKLNESLDAKLTILTMFSNVQEVKILGELDLKKIKRIIK